ncbi:MAG: hypothetical protein NTU44_16165 [Bacteroidetes bacterium]|nr:hypothetical protein [Bacteroidota bacterium]
MKNYIQQLVEDLEKVALNPPQAPYFETPQHLESVPEMAEIALTPFRSIAEWTGIGQEVFPFMTDLEDGQWQQVTEAIFKVFESLHIDLVDKPDDIPPECLYDVLTTNWDTPVQYLPSSGFDMELCTGDPDTCPYWGYCDCGDSGGSEIFPEFNGIYTDEGVKIDPETVPLPALCIRCRQYLSPDAEENMLCLMNRHDQMNEKDFNCGSFEKA